MFVNNIIKDFNRKIYRKEREVRERMWNMRTWEVYHLFIKYSYV